MGYSEFPHTNYEDTDFHELIKLVRDLRGKYSGTLNEINDLRARLDAYEKDVDSRINSAVQSAINLYKNEQIAENNRKWAEMEQKNNLLWTAHKKEVSEQLSEFDSELTSFETRISDMERTILNNHNQTTDNLNAFMTEVNNVLDKLTVDFVHEVNTKLEEIKDTLPLEIDSIHWLWDNVLGAYGYNAIEWYNDSSITCEDWNNSEITCADWYTNGKFVFNWFDNRHRMISPVSGNIVTPQKAIYELTEKLKVNAITAGEYDSQRITADEFDCMMQTSGQYDWGARLFDIRSTVEQKGE